MNQIDKILTSEEEVDELLKPQKKLTGCYLCIGLQYFESDYEDPSPEGYYCDLRDAENFKTFPCVRKLKCFIPRVPEPLNENL